jgi:hypothetical protein
MPLPPLPDDAIKAHTYRRRPPKGNAKWFADYTKDGVAVSRDVTDKDAWNFDIENGLLVWIVIGPDNTCNIIRKKGNKKYVQI